MRPFQVWRLCPPSPGTYTITWIYLDPHDPTFFTTQPQTVVVNDTTPPILTLNGSATMIVEACAAPFVDPGATAIDTCDGVLAVSVGGDSAA